MCRVARGRRGSCVRVSPATHSAGARVTEDGNGIVRQQTSFHCTSSDAGVRVRGRVRVRMRVRVRARGARVAWGTDVAGVCASRVDAAVLRCAWIVDRVGSGDECGVTMCLADAMGGVECEVIIVAER